MLDPVDARGSVMGDIRSPDSADVCPRVIAPVEGTARGRSCASATSVECASTDRSTATSAHIHGSTDLRLALSVMSLGPERGRHDKACNGGAMAPWGLPVVLALEVKRPSIPRHDHRLKAIHRTLRGNDHLARASRRALSVADLIAAVSERIQLQNTSTSGLTGTSVGTAR